MATPKNLPRDQTGANLPRDQTGASLPRDRTGATGRARSGETAASQHGEAVPSLPSERDESADSQAHAIPERDVGHPDSLGRKAADDLKHGRKDTGPAPVMDRVYHGLRRR